MKPLTADWIEKAEGDFLVATQLMQRRHKRVLDAVCFHSQQTVEKYFKARLFEAGISFPKSHDLVALLKLLLPVEPLWSSFEPAVMELTDYAVNFRYPGETATVAEARQCVKNCRAVRREVRASLGLSV